ncbi:hypothetical protein EXIGLDRAFT_830618 [Exidia glandulosa HHB12029]|uniref:Transcription factor domain-containing protein n=1 Tax=Exidia glandulosa HHB12029 TaxID=1314781 RepID=A0A165NH11_EXIGL|nr:hypothetical protein EXIGLDRAFT_830618 [Exidia glandulosa HHB12029]
MRLRGVGINGILALLLLCDFDQFTAADWDLVASLLRRYSNMYLSRTAARTLQNELWLADWFARLLICHQGDAVFVSSAGMLITRLMAKSKGYLPGSIVDLPFLYDYLGSSLFCEIRHTHDELRSISKLAVVAVHLSGMAPSINPARRFAHITSNVLIASKSLSRVGDSESGLGICYEITLLFLWLLHYKAGDHPDKSQLKGLVQHLSDLLNCLLKPVSSSPSDARSPIFEVIIRRAVTSGSSSYNVTVQMSTAWRLTCRIAAGLSFIARHRQCGNIDEVEPLIDSFFASVRCSSLLRLWISCTQFDSSLASPDWDESNVLFIQHRMDMRPSWWRTGLEELLENAHSDTATASAREYALWLNDEAARRGPCRICPGVPLGWDTAEHDDAHDI